MLILAALSSVPIVIIIYQLISKRMKRSKTMCLNDTDLSGKLVIITGANTGIGKETAREMAKKGARVILACRNLDKATSAAEEIRADVSGASIAVKQLDLSLMKSVNAFADEIEKEEDAIDVLINNAGVMLLPMSYTSEGFEYSYATNHLGHFLLTNRLLGLVEKSSMKRILVVSSPIHRLGKVDYNGNGDVVQREGWAQYNNTKLMNCMFGFKLAEIVKPRGICVFIVGPTLVDTELFRGATYGWFTRIFKGLVDFFYHRWAVSPNIGCQTSVYCATEPGIEIQSGSYYFGCQLETMSTKVSNANAATKLWDYSTCQLAQYLDTL